MSTTPKFEMTYPSGFQLVAADYAFPIPDKSGDGKDDIELDGRSMNDRLLIDGSTGAVIYYLRLDNDHHMDFI